MILIMALSRNVPVTARAFSAALDNNDVVERVPVPGGHESAVMLPSSLPSMLLRVLVRLRDPTMVKVRQVGPHADGPWGGGHRGARCRDGLHSSASGREAADARPQVGKGRGGAPGWKGRGRHRSWRREATVGVLLSRGVGG